MDTNTKPTKSETSRLRRRLSIFGRNNSNHHPESSSISSPDTNTPITSNTPIESNVSDPIQDDSYFGSVTGLVSDYYSSTINSVYNASNEASRYIPSLSAFENSATTQVMTEKSTTSDEIDKSATTPTRSNSQQQYSTRQMSANRGSLKWLLVPNNNPYHSITGASSVTSPAHHLRPNQSVDAVRKLLAVVSVEERDQDTYSVRLDSTSSLDDIENIDSNGSHKWIEGSSRSSSSVSERMKKQDGAEWGSSDSLWSSSSGTPHAFHHDHHNARPDENDLKQVMLSPNINNGPPKRSSSFGTNLSEGSSTVDEYQSDAAVADLSHHEVTFISDVKPSAVSSKVSSSHHEASRIATSISRTQPSQHRGRSMSKAETASRLGEGTIRALRDLRITEAIELRQALRYWAERLERPRLYYVECGPRYWIQQNKRQISYDHQKVVGQKVSQLQAILARRCSCIGELQLHLWRAGWQKGVAQWGILGQGNEWAAVAGGDVEDLANLERELNFDSVDGYVTANHNATNTSSGSASFFGLIGGSAKKYWKSASSRNSDSISNSNGGLKNRLRRKHSIHADALLFVKNSKGGKIVSDDSALAAWSVDAIRIVRDQLYSATSDASPLPFFQNWPREKHRFSQEDQAAAIRSDIQKNCDHLSDDEDPLQNSMMSNGSSESELFQKKNALNESMPRQNLSLPLWALDEATNSISASDINVIKDEDRSQVLPYVEEASKSITIKDLSLFISELRELINSMETAMHTQRKRRVDKLKPPSRLKRNWYVIAIVVPTTAYIFYNTVMKENDGVKLLAKEVYQKISSFCAEHVSEPLQSIYRELFTRRGREDVTDKKARDNTIEILKKMIKSWLDETFPDMVESKRESMANAMDMCLIEDKKEFSIKNIFEINNIVRMSLIEMQFIKKEMMNALVQMDELMGSNEINIKLAAMTPAFILAKSIQVAGKQLFYVLLKIRKSKEQTYASFRHIILDIERLLVMRDNPPSTPLPLTNGAVSYLNRESEGVDIIPGGLSGSPTKSMFSDAPVATINHNDAISSVLNSDDLGMLILLVHEGRQILWQDRRRFSRQELRNISEDLAELAGERGAVSVRQQLRIIARMCRTYSFLDSSKIKMDQVAL